MDKDALHLQANVPHSPWNHLHFCWEEKYDLGHGRSDSFRSAELDGKLFFTCGGILLSAQFELIDQRHAYRAPIEEVPNHFQRWACKQVHGVAGTNKQLSSRGETGRPAQCDPAAPSQMKQRLVFPSSRRLGRRRPST